MKYNKYKEEIIKHLVEYKENKLKVKEEGKYRGALKPHILPLDETKPKKEAREDVVKCYNLLECVRKFDFLLKDNLHIYAHHLNSSQIMCYNFFRPFVDKEMQEKLIKLLKDNEVDIDITQDIECRFEYENKEKEWDDEQTGNSKKTNFDFYVGAGKKEVFFEIKYTEQAFGDYKKEEIERHRVKYRDFYKEKIEKCPAIEPKIEFGEVFRKNYQLIRTVIRVTDHNKYAVFVYDERNENTCNQFKHFKDEYISDEYKGNVIGITWQKLLEGLDSIHSEQFRDKYL